MHAVVEHTYLYQFSRFLGLLLNRDFGALLIISQLGTARHSIKNAIKSQKFELLTPDVYGHKCPAKYV